MPLPRIVVARRITEAAAARARRDFDALMAEHDMDAAETIAAAAAHRAEAILIGGTSKLDAAAIAQLPDHVRLIANSSVGYDHMDAAAAKARGILVTNTPDVLTDCTADLAFMLLLGACRRAHEYDALMRAGWRRKLGLPDMLGVKPSGKALGIVGMGRIGQAVARRARAFGLTVHYHNRHRLPPAVEAELGATWHADLDEMLSVIDLLTIHTPRNADSENLLDARRIARLRRHVYLINASRGGIVDEEALVDALEGGRLAGAGLDVWAHEPAIDPRLLALPNVVMTPHMGSATLEGRVAMGEKVITNIRVWSDGHRPPDQVLDGLR